ncbi:MAG: sugar ABC transporter permease, partial [Acetatifactor sp.]|nr:sugar ABC transporter permease [Acetatifactor sp.]
MKGLRKERKRERKYTLQAIRKDWKTNYFAYLLLIPVIAWYIIFCYAPMGGLAIAFRDFKPLLGIAKSKPVGFKYF